MSADETKTSPGERVTHSPPHAELWIRVPVIVCAFFLGDLAVALASVMNCFAKVSLGRDYYILHLDGEQNVGAWFSSAQLFTVGLLLATFAWSKRAWSFLLAAGMFFLLSLDEVAEIHELIGRKIDQYTHFESRPHSVLAQSGPWMLVCVPLLLIAVAVLVKLTRPYWRTGVAVKFAIGLAVLIGSGAGLELLSNLMTHGLAGHLQVLLEETGEMIGETICLWAAYDLLVAHGIELVKCRDEK